MGGWRRSEECLANCKQKSSRDGGGRQEAGKVENRSIVYRLDHSLDVVVRGRKGEELMAAMLEPEILFFLLHLRHRILDESQVTDLVRDRVDDADRHAIDLAQIDGGRVDLTVDPILEADRLLELLR